MHICLQLWIISWVKGFLVTKGETDYRAAGELYHLPEAVKTSYLEYIVQNFIRHSLVRKLKYLNHFESVNIVISRIVLNDLL